MSVELLIDLEEQLMLRAAQAHDLLERAGLAIWDGDDFVDAQTGRRLDLLVGALALSRRDWRRSECTHWLSEWWPTLVEMDGREDPEGLLELLKLAPGADVEPYVLPLQRAS